MAGKSEADLIPVPKLPKPNKEDPEDVAWALSTAEAMWSRAENADAIKWIRRAAEAASEAEHDDRALELAKAAADLASMLVKGDSPPSQVPPPTPGPAPTTLQSRVPASPAGSSIPHAATQSVPSAPPVPKLPSTTSAAPPAIVPARGSSTTPKVPSMAPPKAPSVAAPKPASMAPPKAPSTPAAAPTPARTSAKPPAPHRAAPPQAALPKVTSHRADRRGRRSSPELLDRDKVTQARGEQETTKPDTSGPGSKRSLANEPRRRRSRPPADEAGAPPSSASLSSKDVDSEAQHAAALNETAESHAVAVEAADEWRDQTRVSVEAPRRVIEPSTGELRASQAVRVVVWRTADGVHVAPAGTTVAAIAVDALLVALDPTADLAAWLKG